MLNAFHLFIQTSLPWPQRRTRSSLCWKKRRRTTSAAPTAASTATAASPPSTAAAGQTRAASSAASAASPPATTRRRRAPSSGTTASRFMGTRTVTKTVFYKLEYCTINISLICRRTSRQKFQPAGVLNSAPGAGITLTARVWFFVHSSRLISLPLGIPRNPPSSFPHRGLPPSPSPPPRGPPPLRHLPRLPLLHVLPLLPVPQRLSLRRRPRGPRHNLQVQHSLRRAGARGGVHSVPLHGD